MLIISILVGMVFLFTSQLKDTTGSMDLARTTTAVTNETLTTVTESGEDLTYSTSNDVTCTIVIVTNATGGETIASGNYTQSNCNLVSAAGSGYNNTNWNVSYTANYIDSTAWTAINDTEGAGSTLIDYLPLLFLAIIFGTILIVVLRVLLPYINLGGKMDTGF